MVQSLLPLAARARPIRILPADRSSAFVLPSLSEAFPSGPSPSPKAQTLAPRLAVLLPAGQPVMPQPRPHIQDTDVEPYGQIRIRGNFVLNVFRAADGRFYTDHPHASGPFRDRWHLRNAIRYLFDCRGLPRLVTQVSPVVTEDSSPPPPSDKLVDAIAESASELTLQEVDVSSSEELLPSSEESITSSPGTLPHSTTDGSSSFPPFKSEKLVASVPEAASAQTLQDPDVLSSEELLDTTDEEEELSTACPSGVLHGTADSSPLSGSSVGPPILFRDPPNWYESFNMRMDSKGYLHMYPDLGGPYKSLQEAEAAINHYLNERRDPEICQKPSEGSLMEWRIKQCLYYPDGTPKRGPNSAACKNPNEQQRQLVKALLDQYNDYHNLGKDLAHELKDLVSFQWIIEDQNAYYHFNFTTKTKKSDDVNLFFAEVSQMQKEYVWVVSCCCMIGPNDHGLCYGCCNNGKQKIRHPENTRAYIGGHVDGYLPFGGDDFSDSDEDDEAFEARIRFMMRE